MWVLPQAADEFDGLKANCRYCCSKWREQIFILLGLKLESLLFTALSSCLCHSRSCFLLTAEKYRSLSRSELREHPTIQQWTGMQGRIYIGASGSMAPGPEVPGGPFKSKEETGKLIISLLRGPQAQTEPMGIYRAMFGAHHFRGLTILGGPSLYGAHSCCSS